jgi:hypothetical protein
MIWKIVFRDDDTEKRVFGTVSFEGPLVRIDTDRGNTVYVNKSAIIFMKELGGN